MKTKVLYNPAYPIRIHLVSFRSDHGDLKRMFKKYGRDMEGSHAFTANGWRPRYSHTGERYQEEVLVIAFDVDDDVDKVTHGVVAHECLHVVNAIYENLGIEYSTSNDEAAAYLLSWLVDECVSFLGI